LFEKAPSPSHRSKFDDGSLLSSIRVQRVAPRLAKLGTSARSLEHTASRRNVLPLSPHSPRGKRISFADEAGKQLCVVHYFSTTGRVKRDGFWLAAWDVLRTRWMYVGPVAVILIVIAIVLAISL